LLASIVLPLTAVGRSFEERPFLLGEYAREILLCGFLPFALCAQTGAAAQNPAANPVQPAAARAPRQDAPRSMDDITERIFKREPEVDETISSYTPIIETYIQEQKSNALMGTLPDTDVYFLGQADFRGGRLHVHSMTEKTHTLPGIRPSKWPGMWSYDPAGFLQMVFLDWGGFNKVHYQFKPAGREFLGDVRCYVFDVTRMPNAKGPRFRGRIWVEDQDLTIVRMNGSYARRRLNS
jgi:hypothetical protein